MKKNIRKIGMLLFVTMLLLGCITANATTKNVTSTMKSNKNFVKICKYVSKYTDCYLAERRNYATVTHSMSGKNQLDMAAYIAYNTGGSYRFTKSSIHSWTNKVFGTKPSVSLIPSWNSSSASWIAKRPSTDNLSNMPYKYRGGDWGCYKPIYKITKVLKDSRGFYLVTIQNKLGSWESSTVKILGTTTLTIKKNKNSSLQYKVTKIKTKGNGIGYF